MDLRVLVVQHGDKCREPGDPGLTPSGRGQAAMTAAHLERTALLGVWSSPLRRARETAEVIAGASGAELASDDRLRERMNWVGGSETIDDFLEDWARASADREHRPRSGDSSRAAVARFLAALADVRSVHPSGVAVVVAHGGVTTDALRDILGDDEVERRAPGIVDGGIPPCAITTLQAEGDGWSVVEIAQTGHLAPVSDVFTGADLEELAELVAHGWEIAGDRDWSAPAGTLEWSCAKTADHAIDTVIAPAFFLASRRLDDYPDGGWSPGEGASPPRLADGLRTVARLLAATVRGTDPEVRAIIWRFPTVEARPPLDFVPRGALELILHASDVAAGLQIAFAPPTGLCERLRRHTRDWPHWTVAPGWSSLAMDGDPWSDLLVSSGRSLR